MLTLLIMSDMLESNLSYFYPLQYNTDGLSFVIKKSELDTAISLFDKLSNIDSIPYEYVIYDKMIINDVNNYIAIDVNGNIKTKGVFEDYNDIIKQGAYHKDTSAMIIPKALKAFFIEGIPVEDTINKENSIYEFCYGVKGSSLYSWLLTEYNPKLKLSKSEIIHHRFLRYYAGGYQTISKFWLKGKKQDGIDAVEANTPVTLLLNVPKEDILDLDRKGEHKPRYNANGDIIYRYPNLNRDWYISQCYKIIEQIN